MRITKGIPIKEIICPNRDRLDAVKATQIVREYLKPFASFEPVSATRKGEIYLVKVNIGLFKNKILEFEVSDDGQILSGM